MAPKMLPWSVRAIAGNWSSFALATGLSSWAAPSSKLYSEGTCRWTNSLCCISCRALLPLDRRRRLRRDVEHHPIDALDLVDDAVANRAQAIIREPRPVRGHRVLAHDGPHGDDLRVGANVARDAHGPHGQQH